jgi:Ca2+-binding EF-hand superfamily protein
MANNLTCEEEKKVLTEQFKALDTNGDGVLTKIEIKNAYLGTNTKLTNEEIDEILI